MMNTIINMDAAEGLKQMEAGSVNTCITSPPYYGLRDYGADGQIGLESTPEEYIARLVEVFREVKRVLRDDGTLWVNIGDSYAGSGKGRNPDGTVHCSALMAKQGTSAGTVTGNVQGGIVPNGCKPKDLIGIPWMLAFALRADGWYLRQDIIWSKPNPMPESATDRCTKSHEYIFLLSKSAHYYYDAEAIKEPCVTHDENVRDRDAESNSLNKVPGRSHMNGLTHNDYTLRNKRDVWVVPTKGFKGEHFAVFPEELIVPCVIAGCPDGGTVLDPFMGSGTTAIVAIENNRNYMGCEINQKYVGMINKRAKQAAYQTKIEVGEPLC